MNPARKSGCLRRRTFAAATLLSGLLIGLLTCAAAAAEPTSVRRFALVVGTNNGGGGRVKLRYANTDATRFSHVLSAFGGVAPADIIVLHEATSEGIRSAFERLNMRVMSARRQHRRVELIIYYSGHSDETGLLPSGGRISWAELRAELKTTPADVRIAILDSCASGSLIRSKGGIRRAPFLMDQASDVKGHAYLTSSSADEAAQESDRIGASYFTHHLVTGLRGAADVNSDRRVTLSEAYQYAFHQTLARTEKTRKGPQHPNYDFELAGSGDIVITALGAMASTMLFEKAMGGRFFIRDDRGRLVAELEKIPGRRVELGLDPGKYRVNLHQNDRMFTTEVVLQKGVRTALQSDRFEQTRNREMTRSRGEQPQQIGQIASEAPTAAMNLQLVPGLSLLGVAVGSTITKLSLNIIGGLNHSVSGVEAAGVFNLDTADVTGWQYAGVFNMVGGAVRGVQAAGAVNVTAGMVTGVQAAGAVNIASGGVKGMQAGVVNIAGGTTDGGQFGVTNVAGVFTGAQAGVVNIASDARGLQLGVVNIAKSGDGHAIGLLNFIGNGYNRVEGWVSDTSMANVGIKFGSKWMYTIAAVGVSTEPNQRNMTASLGWGGHITAGRWFVDIDALSGVAIEEAGRMERRVDLLSKARITIGRFLGESFAVFGGAALNGAVGFDGRDPRTLPFGVTRTYHLDGQTCLSIGPGLFLGASI